MKNIKLTEQLTTDFTNYSSYDNIRKIASYVDGLKNSSRKIIWTVMDKNINSETKVNRLDAIFQEHTEYLHGSAVDVIVGLAQDYVSSNNMPLLTAGGNFGNRFIPDNSAPRYIFTKKRAYLDYVFNKDDFPIQEKQYFEGSEIEPKFMLPTIPLLLVNGSQSPSIGFAQKIYPRPLKNVIKHTRNALEGKKSPKGMLDVGYDGFEGSIEVIDGQTIMKGIAKKTSITKVEVTELPPLGYTLKSYTEYLDTLEEKGLIKSYKDFSADDKFKFVVNFESKRLSELTEDNLLELLGLVYKNRENFTCIDENNKIAIFDDIYAVFDAYFKVKLEYMSKRKEYMLNKLMEDIKLNASKFIFIQSIINGKIHINNRKRDDIIEQINSVDKIIKHEDSYDYLLRMPVYSLTQEKMEELKELIKKLRTKHEELKEKTPEMLWLDDLEILEKSLKKK